MVRGFTSRRDARPASPAPPVFDLAAFRLRAGEFRERAAPATGDSPGERWLTRGRLLLERFAGEADPITLGAEVLPFFRRPWTLQKKSFDDNDLAYEAWQAFLGKPDANPVRVVPLQDELLAPFDAWLSQRLVRVEPIVVALHEGVKTRRRVLDQLDLLLKLRDLLGRDLGVRGELQRLFDHIFVDEFQDTDPLQGEIVVFLCERTPAAKSWREVDLADGKLTIVGDPKQSIYRFRRADIAMYAEVRGLLAKGPHVDARLVTNFRSRGSLLDWLNDRFTRILALRRAPMRSSMPRPARSSSKRSPRPCPSRPRRACMSCRSRSPGRPSTTTTVTWKARRSLIISAGWSRSNVRWFAIHKAGTSAR